jgi:hypothetical protein
MRSTQATGAVRAFGAATAAVLAAALAAALAARRCARGRRRALYCIHCWSPSPRAPGPAPAPIPASWRSHCRSPNREARWAQLSFVSPDWPFVRPLSACGAPGGPFVALRNVMTKALSESGATLTEVMSATRHSLVGANVAGSMVTMLQRSGISRRMRE